MGDFTRSRRPGDAKVVPNEGMPIKGTTDFGALVMEFDIIFPESGTLSELERVALERVLPKASSGDSTVDAEDSEVSSYVLEELDRDSLPKEQPEQYDDDGFGGNPGGAQCAQQ